MPIRWAFLKRALAGAIFGLYVAHLLYFLNPQVDITPLRLAAVTILYGIVSGLLFGAALWGLRALRVQLLGRPEREGEYRPHGFGFVVLAAFFSAAIYWIHLGKFRIYLPIGAIRVLSKATVLITVTAFLLLLLWVAERGASRRTSRAIFICGCALIAISSFFLYQRRESYRTETRNVVVADVGTLGGPRPVLFVVIRNLPYDWILTMTGEGSLPFFEQARQHDFFTRLEPFPANGQDALWASLATGKLPFRHGVTGSYSYKTLLNGPEPSDRFLLLPAGVGFGPWALVPPVHALSARLPAGDTQPLWQLFERLQLQATVVNWPATSNGATRVAGGRLLEQGDARDGTPPQFAADARAKVLATRGTPEGAARFNGVGDARPRIFAGLAEDAGAVAIAHDAASLDGNELTAVALEGFSIAQRAIHIYANELPPRSQLKGEVVRAYVEQLDRMLSDLARRHPSHLIVIVSPSGPAAPPIPSSAFTIVRAAIDPVDPGADDGFVLIHGPGTAHREDPQSALAEDLVPTILFAAGLPVGRDMDGRVVTDAFSDDFLRRSNLSFIQTYGAQQIVVKRGAP